MTFASIIASEFKQNNTRTLKDLYASLSANPDVALEGSILKHRIRSALYGLKKANKIELVATATYKITKTF